MAIVSPASPRNVGAVQPPCAARLLHTQHTLSKSPSPPTAFSSYAASPPSPRLPLLRYHFVCLSRGGPSRRALPYSRTTLLAPRVHIYRSRTRALSHIAPAMYVALHLSLICVFFATRESVDYTLCVFYESRGKPR